jgi:predicted Zn-dependent protease with MMP-like domain
MRFVHPPHLLLESALEIFFQKPYMLVEKGAVMARVDQTDDWRDRHAPTISTFESLAIEAYGNLPEEFRALTGNLTIEIEDFPDDEIFEDMALETPFDLLGLFEGRGISERFSMETGELPNRIRLYRRPIIDYWAENEETLGDIITHVLIHEIGHHFGLSDDDMERIEESVEDAADRTG